MGASSWWFGIFVSSLKTDLEVTYSQYSS